MSVHEAALPSQLPHAASLVLHIDRSKGSRIDRISGPTQSLESTTVVFGGANRLASNKWVFLVLAGFWCAQTC